MAGICDTCPKYPEECKGISCSADISFCHRVQEKLLELPPDWMPDPCDVIVYLNEGMDPISRFSRWAIGPWEHVSLYLGQVFIPTPTPKHPDSMAVPLIYESVGRGVSIKSLESQSGKLVGFFRPTLGALELNLIITWAVAIASDPQSYYDYFSIVTNCVPRVLKEKFPFLPISSKYHRDPAMICSEAVAELFWRIGLEVVPRDVIPLPIDFTISPILQFIGSKRL